jgi:hypothetical protein
LKAQKKLSNPVLKLFFSPNIDVLDLTGILMTDSTLQKMTACRNLTSLNLKGQFTIVTNNALGLIAKRLTKLRFLGVGDCKYITGAYSREPCVFLFFLFFLSVFLVFF